MRGRKLSGLAITLGTIMSATMIATPAEAASNPACATNYKIVSVSVKYKACARNPGSGVKRVNGLRLNDHGSPVTVSYQFALRDVTSGAVTYGGTWFTQTWPAGAGTISHFEDFGCIRGHTVRGLLHVRYNGVTGPWSESPASTCPR